MRAYQPWPGTFLETDAGRVIVWDARPLGGGATRRPGTLLALPANRAALAASDGLLELIEVQPAGGRRMTGAELLRGRPALVGSLVRIAVGSRRGDLRLGCVDGLRTCAGAAGATSNPTDARPA